MVFLPKIVLFRRGESSDVYALADTLKGVIAKLPAAEKVAFGLLTAAKLTELNDNTENQGATYVDFEDHSCGVVSFDHGLGRNISKNGAPFQETARAVDTGFSGSKYTLMLDFGDRNGPNPALEKIRKWAKSKNTNNEFKQGKIGIYNEWSLPTGTTGTDIEANTGQKLPTKESGYIIQSITTMKDLDKPLQTHATLVLEEALIGT